MSEANTARVNHKTFETKVTKNGEGGSFMLKQKSWCSWKVRFERVPGAGLPPSEEPPPAHMIVTTLASTLFSSSRISAYAVAFVSCYDV